MQRVGAASSPVDGVHRTFDAVEAGRQRLTHALPGGELSLVSALAQSLVGVRAQVLNDSDRFFLHLTVLLESDFELGGDDLLQFLPGPGAAQRELGSQRLFGDTHEEAARLRRFLQVESVLVDRAGVIQD